MIVVTGATGKLGRHVINELIKRVPASQVVAAVRSVDKAQDLAALGVQVREADYKRPESLASAFAGAEKVLLISSSDLDGRVEQHQAVIDASLAARVKLIAYTGILRSDTSKIELGADHLVTEKAIRESGIPFVFLRNGWYLENHVEPLGAALEHGAILGAAKDGRFSAAGRLDYAAAAAVVLAQPGHENKIYELAGDQSYSLGELAAKVSEAAHKPVVYKNLPAAEYQAALAGFGLPAPMPFLLANADECAATGDLESDSRDLSTLIGRPTTTLDDALKASLSK
jgi:NAD(P)H dehydrogenase (quinone)